MKRKRKNKIQTKTKYHEINTINNDSNRWESIELTIDSGAGNNVAPNSVFPWIPLQANEKSRLGRYYITANGKKVYVLGEKVVPMKMKDGKMKKIRFQIADVTKILVAVSKIAEADNKITMHKDGRRGDHGE